MSNGRCRHAQRVGYGNGWSCPQCNEVGLYRSIEEEFADVGLGRALFWSAVLALTVLVVVFAFAFYQTGK